MLTDASGGILLQRRTDSRNRALPGPAAEGQARELRRASSTSVRRSAPAATFSSRCDPEFNGAAQHSDRLPAVTGRAIPGRVTGQPHRAEPKTVDSQIPQPPGTCRIGRDQR
jgi:hypothetical protein